MHLQSSKTWFPSFAIACALIAVAGGCTSVGPQSIVAAPAGPVYVPNVDSTRVWERIVDVLHEYHFTIARENRLEGVIETEYKPGASVFEPWHQDSVGSPQRWESTFQSIRRRVVITFQPAGDGGNFINVRVDKEIEDIPGLAANSTGAATFGENQTLERNLDPVVGQAGATRWLPRGRDPALEQVLNTSIRNALMR
jgi:hypothetical protein